MSDLAENVHDRIVTLDPETLAKMFGKTTDYVPEALRLAEDTLLSRIPVLDDDGLICIQPYLDTFPERLRNCVSQEAEKRGGWDLVRNTTLKDVKGEGMKDVQTAKGAPLDIWSISTSIIAVTCYFMFIVMHKEMEPEKALQHTTPLSVFRTFKYLGQWGMGIFSVVGVVTGIIAFFSSWCSRGRALVGLLISLTIVGVLGYGLLDAVHAARRSQVILDGRRFEHALNLCQEDIAEPLPVFVDNERIVALLTGVPKKEDKQFNPSSKNFLPVPQNRIVRGVLVDPWGTEYRILKATQKAGAHQDEYEIIIGETRASTKWADKVGLWSFGRNKHNDNGTKDDVLFLGELKYNVLKNRL